LLGARLLHWPTRELGPLHVLHAAHEMAVAPSAVLERIAELAPLGLEAPAVGADVLDARGASLSDEDRRVLFSRSRPWGLDVDPWYAREIFDASRELGRSPAAILARLDAAADLGVRRPGWIDADALVARAWDALSDEDLYLLNTVREGGKVSLTGLVSVSKHRGIPLRRAWQRLASLAPLGFGLPPVDPDALDVVRAGDEELLSWYEGAVAPFLDRRVPRWHLLLALAAAKAKEPAEILARLAALAPLGVRLPPGAAEQIDRSGLGEEDLLLLEASPCNVTLRMIEVAQETGRSLGHVLAVADRLGMVPHAFAYDFTTSHGDYVPDAHDVRMFGCAAYHSEETREGMERFRRDARYRLWYLDEAAFATRFTRLAPLLARAIGA
jgi:hypothetical protein